MFQLPIEYEPRQNYSRQEMIDLIKAQAPVLCFFAKTNGEQRCVLGLDFDNYNAQTQMIPVHVIPVEAVKEMLIPVHGNHFKRAYGKSRIGKKIIITFQSRQAAGWFQLGWQLEQSMLFTSE